MRKNTRYFIFPGIAAALILLILVIPKGKKGNEKTSAGPETVVKNFSRAVIDGDWEEACSLCDSTIMNEYVESYKKAREAMAEEDSASFALAEEILAGTVIKIESTEQVDGTSRVTYSLMLDGNNKKRHTATVKKEKGAWKVVEITGGN